MATRGSFLLASTSLRIGAACFTRRPQELLFRRLFLARKFSSLPEKANNKKISIHFGTSSGTSQLFAMELQNNLQERAGDDVEDITVSSLAETPSVDKLDPEALHFFLVSTAGVGEPPGPAVPFFQSLDSADASALSKLRFSVFGLGNSAAHPNHYNVAGKTLHSSLVDRQAEAWLPLALGDDGDCIEEDFDQWQEAVVKKLKQGAATSVDDHSTTSSSKRKDEGEKEGMKEVMATSACLTNSSSSPSPTSSNAFGDRLKLVPIEVTEEEITRTDLFDVIPSWYHPDTKRWKVHHHVALSRKPTSSSLHELELELDWKKTSPPLSDRAVSYDAGDHLVVYPSQADYIVEAYLNYWNIDANTAMHSKVELVSSEQGESTYPHPTGISLYETLRFCVDLHAPPGPRLARVLTGRDDLDYKEEVFKPRQSPLALLKQAKNTEYALEDLLYHLPSIVPRYYSIASSPLMHRNSVFLTYRPVHYISSLGTAQHGLCTSFFSDLRAGSTLLAYINKNPSFRLPADPSAPVILLAGGCGVAAIRSLMEELQARQSMNKGETKTPVYIFVGFRNSVDAAYVDMMEALEPDLLEVSYSSSSAKTSELSLITDRVRARGATVYDLMAYQGAYLYACGGARTFGAAVQKELYALYETHGHCNEAQAKAKLQEMIHEGRYCEDLAD